MCSSIGIATVDRLCVSCSAFGFFSVLPQWTKSTEKKRPNEAAATDSVKIKIPNRRQENCTKLAIDSTCHNDSADGDITQMISNATTSIKIKMR